MRCGCEMHRSPQSVHRHLLSCCKTLITRRSTLLQPHTPTPSVFYYNSCSSITSKQPQQQEKQLEPSSSIGIGFPSISQSRLQKLIASQSDPLLAKEIFDLASRQQPNSPHYSSTFHTLILKLGRSRHFSLMESLVSRLKSHSYRDAVPPSLFSHIIRIYGDAGFPEKALRTFCSILEFNVKPLPTHLNRVLQVLVARRAYLRPAFDLFKSAHQRYGISPNAKSYNILIRAFCLNGRLSIAYSLFNQMFKRDVFPNVESYRILMQGLCRRSQVNKALDLLEDMLNKGFVPDSLSYTTLLNSLCRKKKFREAYKLLCRMKVKGCNPDIVHYNTLILGLCRESRALDACKVLQDIMPSNGCLPNVVSYRTLVGGLCHQGMYDEANKFIADMMSMGFSPHFSLCHSLIKGLCNAGKIEEACGVLGQLLSHGETPHPDTWLEVVPRICEVDGILPLKMRNILEDVLRVEIKPGTRIVQAGASLGEYMLRKTRAGSTSTSAMV